MSEINNIPATVAFGVTGVGIFLGGGVEGERGRDKVVPEKRRGTGREAGLIVRTGGWL